MPRLDRVAVGMLAVTAVVLMCLMSPAGADSSAERGRLRHVARLEHDDPQNDDATTGEHELPDTNSAAGSGALSEDWTADLVLPKPVKQSPKFPHLMKPVDVNRFGRGRNKGVVTNSAKGVFIVGWNGKPKVTGTKTSVQLLAGKRYLKNLGAMGIEVKKQYLQVEKDAQENRILIGKLAVRVNEMYQTLASADPYRQVMDLKDKFEMVSHQVKAAYKKLSKVRRVEEAIATAKVAIEFMEKKSVARVVRQMRKIKKLSEVVNTAAANASKIGSGVEGLGRTAGRLKRKVMGLERKMEKDRLKLDRQNTKLSSLSKIQSDYIASMIKQQQEHDGVIGDLDLKVSKMTSGRANFEMRVSSMMRNWQQRMLLKHKQLIDNEFRIQTLRLKSSLKNYENSIMDELEDFVSSRFNSKVAQMEDVVKTEVRRELTARYGKETTEQAETQDELPKSDTLKEGWLFPKESPEQVLATKKAADEAAATGKPAPSAAAPAGECQPAGYQLPNNAGGKKACTCIDLATGLAMDELLETDESTGSVTGRGKIQRTTVSPKGADEDSMASAGDFGTDPMLTEVDQELNMAEAGPGAATGGDTARVGADLEKFESQTEGGATPSAAAKPKAPSMLGALEKGLRDPSAPKMLCYCPDNDIDQTSATE